MNKYRIFFIILLFCIPYAFLGIHIEIKYSTLMGYLLAITAAAFLSAQGAKINNKKIIIAGNMLSAILSHLSVLKFATPKWTYFCVPFGPVGSVYAIAIIMVIGSLTGWIIEKEILYRNSRKENNTI